MKKAFLLLLIIPILFTSCTSTPNDIIFATDMVHYNSHGANQFGFNVNLLLPNTNSTVEFVNFDGINVENIDVKFNDDTYDDVKNLNHNGYYMKLLGFASSNIDEYIQIDSITLKIDDVEHTYKFNSPIKHTVEDLEKSSPFEIGFAPTIISTISFTDTSYNFSFTVTEDIIIENIGFIDFIDMKNATVTVNGSSIKDFEEEPFVVEKNSTLSIRTGLELKDKNSTNYYHSFYTDLVIDYRYIDSSEINSCYSYIISQGVSNKEDAIEVINIATQN